MDGSMKYNAILLFIFTASLLQASSTFALNDFRLNKNPTFAKDNTYPSKEYSLSKEGEYSLDGYDHKERKCKIKEHPNKIEAILSENMKQWEPVLGKWIGTLMERDDPQSPWIKSKIVWDVIPHYSYIEIIWRTTTDNRTTTAKEIIRWDLQKRGYVSKHIDDRGISANLHTLEWDGNILKAEYQREIINRKNHPARVTWTHSTNFTKTSAEGEFFSHGNWWTSWKIDAEKI